MVRPGGQILSEILTSGVFPTASLMLLRGGPYPFPLFAMVTAVVVAAAVECLCWIVCGWSAKRVGYEILCTTPSVRKKIPFFFQIVGIRATQARF
jgi:hypothetical protein